jgi:hypothetical protein
MKRFLKILRGLALLAAALLLLAALFLTAGYFHGKQAWDVAGERSQGKPVDFAAFVPPPVPDEENFAMTPLLKPLFGPDKETSKQIVDSLKLAPAGPKDRFAPLGGMWKAERVDLGKWRTYFGTPDVLGALRKFEPQMEEISAALRRPHSRFPLEYEKGFDIALPHLTLLLNAQRLYLVRALAELDAGQPDRAFADVETLLLLTRSCGDEPLLISQLVAVCSGGISEHAVWEGLAGHRWRDDQLTALQTELERVHFLEDGHRAFQYEKVEGAASCLKMARSIGTYRKSKLAFDLQGTDQPFFPLFKVRIYQNILALSQFYDRATLPVIEPALHRVHTEIVEAGEAELRGLCSTLLGDNIVMEMAGNNVMKTAIKFAYAQTLTDEALIACGLERYWLTHGAYPDTLDALVPQYLAKLPHDVITGQPLHYRRTPDGLFVLYSVGWNGRDDGGIPGTKEGGMQDTKQGDWVWRYPSPR